MDQEKIRKEAKALMDEFMAALETTKEKGGGKSVLKGRKV